MSLARKHQARILAMQSAAAVPSSGGHTPARSTATPSVDRAATTMARQIALRLTHDLRRLKEIKSIDAKIAAKREMLPEYAAWVEGLLAGSAQAGAGASGDLLPTMMVWKIDVGNYDGGLQLAEHVLRYSVPMPSRYERDAATLIVEEIAEAAIKAQDADEPFDLSVLERVDELTVATDMHDPVRAKLMRAIGVELDRSARAAAEASNDADAVSLLCRSLISLKEAQRLNDRVGVKGTIKAVEKRIKAATPEQNPAGTTG